MQVYTDVQNLPTFKNVVITIGTFDGVHIGHQNLIAALKSEAKKIEGETVLITFFPHPRTIVQEDKKKIQLLHTKDEKVTLLSVAGVDSLVIVPFTKEFGEQTAAVYVRDWLVKYFNPKMVVVGHDHRFGKNRSGDFDALVALGKKEGFLVKSIAEIVRNDVSISSTKIRAYLLKKEVATANLLLGYVYNFCGVVVRGRQLGRTIGFPTANIHVTCVDKLLPGNGVYVVSVFIEQRELFGMMNIGTRPTVDNSGDRVIEVHLFDFNETVYGKSLRVYIHQFIRDEIKFSNKEALVQQLHKDMQHAKQVINVSTTH